MTSMGSSIGYDEDNIIERHIAKSDFLELSYQLSLRDTDLIAHEETVRRLRLQSMLLEKDNEDLQKQLAIEEERVNKLGQDGQHLHAQLDSTQEAARQAEAELRRRTRELNNVKAELQSMNDVTLDATNVLTEKLALARELSILKPELDHLRSQVTYQQTTLADKLALERQVATLEVELETEKRASRRATERINHSSEKENDLQQQLEEVQRDLSREQREKDKMRREAAKQVEAWESRRNVLENKVDQLKRAAQNDATNDKLIHVQRDLEALQEKFDKVQQDNIDVKRRAEKDVTDLKHKQTILEGKLEQSNTKLRATKEELKSNQADLDKLRADASRTRSTNSRAISTKGSRKRPALDIEDHNIGTPDIVDVRGARLVAKRAKFDQTMVGEKSMFSITPFLSRTTSMLLDSPDALPEATVTSNRKEAELSGTDEQGPNAVGEPAPISPSGAKSQKSKPNKRSTTKQQILGDAKADTGNRKIAASKSKPSSFKRLEQVMEEDIDENRETNIQEDAGGKPTTDNQLKLFDSKEPTKKKRKVLSGTRTLFDEEGSKSTKRPAKITLASSGLSIKKGLGGHANLKAGLGGGGAGAGSNGFDGFSPLKKDRRGTGASFLA